MCTDVRTVLAVVAFSAVSVTKQVTEYALFPRLFHLDDYESCLLRENALYCLGTFQISGPSTNPAVQLIEAYSEDVHNFNRTRLHRGYCVSERCPAPDAVFAHCSTKPRNTSFSYFNNDKGYYFKENISQALSCDTCNKIQDQNIKNARNIIRFERCVSKYIRRQNLHVRLSSLQYCHTKDDVSQGRKIEIQHWLFLGLVAMVVTINIVGTVYDETRGGPKIRLLTVWSIRRNCRFLMCPYPDGDSRLATVLPTEAGRVLLLLLVLLAHAGCIHDQLYLANPKHVETVSHHPMMKLLHNGHSSLQIILLLSSFLQARGLLQASTPPTLRVLPKLMLKRILRISPVCLLVLGYVVTWWPLARGGPQWTPLVEAESAACRNNFWAIAFFFGNFLRDKETCLVQTWFIDVQMQLHVFGLVLTILLSRVRRWALLILGSLFFVSCAANVILAYVSGWTPLMGVAGPENIRTLFSNVEAFSAFYTKPWSNVGACLAGLFMAHLLHELRENGFNRKSHKVLIVCCQLTVLVLPWWTGGAGHLFRDVSSGWSGALLAALDRPVMSLLAAVLLFGIYAGKTNTGTAQAPPGFLARVFSWRALHPLGRMSLAVLMLHWPVNKTLAASRHGLYFSSAIDMVADAVATAFFSYLLAAPVTLLLDLPMQQLARAVSI